MMGGNRSIASLNYFPNTGATWDAKNKRFRIKKLKVLYAVG